MLLGGEAGLRCGEMIALEWSDVDLAKRQLCVQRSDWNGQVTVPKSGRLRLTGGEAGIRTLGTGFSPYNGLANRRLQPLGHLTADGKYT